MARNLSRREVILAGALLAVVLGWLWLRTEDPFAAGVSPADLEQTVDLSDAPSVRMDLLASRDVGFDQGGRDLFKYGQKPLTAEDLAELERRRLAQEAAERARQEAEKRRREEAAKAPPPQPARNVPRGPVTPRIDLKYLGYLGPKDDRIAVFVDGQEIVLAREGEVVKDDFRVVEIQYESVVMGFTRADLESKTQTLNMTRR